MYLPIFCTGNDNYLQDFSMIT